MNARRILVSWGEKSPLLYIYMYSIYLLFILSSFVAGVILRKRVPGFERLLWRACRGNVFLRYTEIEHPMEDPVTVCIFYNVFILIDYWFQGDRRSQVKKICEGLLYNPWYYGTRVRQVKQMKNKRPFAWLFFFFSLD